MRSVAGFVPLFCGVATPERAKRIVEEHLLDRKSFWTRYPVASYAMDEPDYTQEWEGSNCSWRGPAWIPTNYMIAHGLNEYGYRDHAHELARQTLKWRSNETIQPANITMPKRAPVWVLDPFGDGHH